MNQSKIDIREEWEEELKGMIFDRKDFDIDYDKLKSFISSLLHQREMEIAEELNLMFDDDSCECDNCNRRRNYFKNSPKMLNSMKQKIQAKLKTEILEMIEEMKLQVDESKVSPTAKHELYISFKKAYNQACDDIINQINKG